MSISEVKEAAKQYAETRYPCVKSKSDAYIAARNGYMAGFIAGNLMDIHALPPVRVPARESNK
jgi:hypothetical protein